MDVSGDCLPAVSLSRSIEPEVSSISSRKMQVRFLVHDDRALLRGPVILTAAISALRLEIAKAVAADHHKFALQEEYQKERKLASLRLREQVQHSSDPTYH